MNKLLEELRQSRIVIYTVITGSYDTLLEPESIDENCDYVCFTDTPPSGYRGIWQIRKIENDNFLDPVRLARYHKLLPHLLFPEVPFSFYVDGNLRIRASLRDYLEQYVGERPMLCQRHPLYDCIYQEASAVREFRLDDPDVVDAQMRRYRLEGFPSHAGLICSNLLFRRHNDPGVIRVMNDWWAEIRNGSRRDQLSFSYAVWKNGFDYDKTPLYSHDSPYWTAAKHLGSHRVPIKKKSLRQKLNILYSKFHDLLNT